MTQQTYTDSKGRLVPIGLMKEVDILRDDVVQELVKRAQDHSHSLARFKTSVLADIGAFIDLSAEKYDVHFGGHRGNVTLFSFDGRYKVHRQIQDSITFDERLQVAKELIDGCVRDWSRGADDKIKVLVEHAFQVDKTGKISIERVLGLRRLDIDDPQWRKAMHAIGESIQVVSSKTYIRFYERVGSDQWRPISLDLASVGVE